jgi:hypothetical protein
METSVPFVVHFVAGPYHGKGRNFSANPAEVLVIPVQDGEFARYRRSPEELPGRPLVYNFVETFRGE